MISPNFGKTDALVELAARAGLGEVDPAASNLDPLFSLLGKALAPQANPQIGFASAAIAAVAERLIVPPGRHTLPPPNFCNGQPASFPSTYGVQESPAFIVAEIPGGVFAQIARAPVALLSDQRTILADYSSRYAGLVRFFDLDLPHLLAGARPVAGDVLVLCDDIFPLNYSHWLADALPRLAFLGARRDVTVIVSEQDAPFKRETLRACGIDDERLVLLPDFSAVRAECLLVPRDCRELPHPAHKASPWALDFLRSRIGLGALAAARRPATTAKLYVSRADAQGRRVLNEDALMRLLAPAGYLRVTLGDRSVAEQVALFAGASHVIGLHGAGLTNVLFCPARSQLLEILPASYGTPAFYLLAAGSGVRYATYIARDVRSGSRTQVDDLTIDVGDFQRCCGSWI